MQPLWTGIFVMDKTLTNIINFSHRRWSFFEKEVDVLHYLFSCFPTLRWLILSFKLLFFYYFNSISIYYFKLLLALSKRTILRNTYILIVNILVKKRLGRTTFFSYSGLSYISTILTIGIWWNWVFNKWHQDDQVGINSHS